MAFGVDTEVPNTRVILRQPDVIVNRSLIPIQPVAEFALSASYAQSASYVFGSIESASYATYALTASYVSGAVSDWDTLANKPQGIVSSSTQIINYNLFATTGSNIFTGNQTFLGNFLVSGSQETVFSSSVPLVVHEDIQARNDAGEVHLMVDEIEPHLEIYVPSENSFYENAEFGTYQLFLYNTSSGYFGFALDGIRAGYYGWDGPIIGGDTGASTYPAFIGFQDARNYTDGRVTILTPLSASAGITGSLFGTASWANNASTANTASYVDYTNVVNKPTLVSSSAQINTGSFSGSFIGDGSGLTNIASTLTFSGSTGGDILNLKTETLNILGSNGITTSITDNTVTVNLPSGTVTASSQIDYTQIQNQPTTIPSASYVEYNNVVNKPTLVSSSAQINTGSFSGSFTGELIGTSSWANNATTSSFAINTTSATSASYIEYTNVANKPTLVSASSQVDVTQTTNIATIATTGSNIFTGIQNISNTTNSTNYTDGALVVSGGMGIGKDVNISGSLNVFGLLTVVSMSTQYVTSSQYTIGTSRVIVNDDDLVRFAGLSVIDSGSTYGTGSLLWDSLNNRWIYEADDQAYNSAILIAGPKNTGTLGNEVGLISGRIPVATGDDHIDTGLTSSSIYIDFTDRKTYVEAGLYVTGSITASNGISGTLFGTSSWATNAITANTASYVEFTNIANKPTLVSSSLQINTGSFTGSFTGSLLGTSSWATNATSASVSLRSSIQSTGSAPLYPITSELWYDDTTGKTYIYYVSASVGQWVLQSDPTYDPGPSLQDLQEVTDLGTSTTNAIQITNTTQSTSKTSGALIVSGGLGISGNIYAEKVVTTEISGSVVSASAYVGQKSSLIYVIDGGGLTIQTGVKGDLYIPFDCTVTEWVLLSDQVGSIVVDVWSDTYGNYPPTGVDTIAGTDIPTLSSTNKNKSTALTGWNKNITAGNTLRFNVNSVSSITRVTLTLNVTKT